MCYFFTCCFLFRLVERCEDGPTRYDVAMGDIPVDIQGETGCANMDAMTGVGMCTGECVEDRCPQAQCQPIRLQRDDQIRSFMFQCDSKYTQPASIW